MSHVDCDCDFAALDQEIATADAESEVQALVDATSKFSFSSPDSCPRMALLVGRDGKRVALGVRARRIDEFVMRL